MPERPKGLYAASNRQVDARHRAGQCAAPDQTGPCLRLLEVAQFSLGGREGIGFVLKTADGDAHGVGFP